MRMRLLWTVAALFALLSSGTDASAAPSLRALQAGDTYEISLDGTTSQRGTDGSTSSSHDRDTLIERVIGVREAGLELEYDLPANATAEDRARSWQFPARVFHPLHGPMQLLNRAQLEVRVDAWLKAGGIARAECGRWYFTWNAFRVECDPQSVIETLKAFDLDSVDLREGALYEDPKARDPAPLIRAASGGAFIAEPTVDPEAVRRERAEADIVVAELMKKSLTLDTALQAREKEAVSGTISVAFETGPNGVVTQRSKVTKLEIRKANGGVENQTITETVERRQISRPRP